MSGFVAQVVLDLSPSFWAMSKIPRKDWNNNNQRNDSQNPKSYSAVPEWSHLTAGTILGGAANYFCTPKRVLWYVHIHTHDTCRSR